MLNLPLDLWITKDGREVSLSKAPDSHLLNIAWFLGRSRTTVFTDRQKLDHVTALLVARGYDKNKIGLFQIPHQNEAGVWVEHVEGQMEDMVVAKPCGQPEDFFRTLN